MKITVPFNLNQDIFHLISVLLKYDITKGKMDLDLGNLDKEKQESLIQRLKGMHPIYPQKETDSAPVDDDDASGEEENELNLSSTTNRISFSSAPPELTREEKGTKEISDPYILHYFNTRYQKIELVALAEKHQLDINLGKTLVISGPKLKVTQFYNLINSTTYEKSCVMTSDQARCLKKTTFVEDLKRTRDVKLRFLLEGSQDKARLVVYGTNQQNISECKQMLDKFGSNLIILAELTKPYEVEGEVIELFNYFQAKFQSKFETLFKKKGIISEINKIFIKRSNKTIIFFFAKCGADHFRKIEDFINREIRSLCIINVYPKLKSRTGLEKMDGALGDKVSIITLKNDHHCLLIGKAKHLLEHLRNVTLQGPNTNIESFRIRVKKTPGQKVQDVVPGGIAAVSPKPDPYYFVFVIYSKDSKYLLDVLSKFSEVLKKHEKAIGMTSIMDNSVLDISMNMTSRFLLEESFQEDLNKTTVKKEMKQPLLEVIEEKKEALVPYPEQNRNKELLKLYDFEDAVIAVEQDSGEFDRLEKLMKQKYPKVEVNTVIKSCELPLWENYKNSRDKYNSKEILEYILFYDSQEDPYTILNSHMDPRTVAKNLTEYFDPTQHRCFKEEDGTKTIVLYAASFKQNSHEIIGCYPLYCIEFK